MELTAEQKAKIAEWELAEAERREQAESDRCVELAQGNRKERRKQAALLRRDHRIACRQAEKAREARREASMPPKGLSPAAHKAILEAACERMAMAGARDRENRDSMF
jgi:hypothetical protein